MKKNIFSLIALLALSGCALSPVDKQTVTSTTSPVQFNGGTTPSGGLPVQIQALNQNGQWMTIATTQSGTDPFRINFTPPNYVDLYFYNVWQVIPSTYWKPGIFGYKAQVRAQSMSLFLITLDSNSLSCFGNSNDLTYFLSNCKSPNSPVATVFTSDYAGVDRGCSNEGKSLVTAINTYRLQNGKPVIPISPSLCAVAQAHVVDLYVNHPDTGACNLHSWSNKGSWSSCCYTGAQSDWPCMWNKPGELTAYKHTGYEDAAAGVSTASQALAAWKTDPPHNDVILSQGAWATYQWKALGAALYHGYAVVWFGLEPDTVTP